MPVKNQPDARTVVDARPIERLPGPHVAAIILNFNGLQDTRRAVCSLLAIQGIDVRTMVVDNGSTADEAAVLIAEFPAIDVDRVAANLGFARGINRAARRALRSGASHLLLMNSDAWFVDGTAVVRGLLDALAADPSLAAVGPVIRNPDGSLQSAGYAYSLWWPVSRPLRAPARAKSAAFISGSCMLIDGRRFAALGGFDPDFFLYGEDLDFALRAKFAGWRVAIVPDAYAYHTRGASSSILSNRYAYTALRGALIVMKKHARWYQLPSAATAAVAISAGLVLFGLRAGNGRAGYAVAKAWLDFFARRWSGLSGEPLVPADRPSLADVSAP